MYNKIIDKNNTGKTNKLIELAAQDPVGAIIVCQSPLRMKEKIHILGYDCITDNIIPVTYEDYIYNKEQEYDGYNIFIDDLDKLINCYDPMINGYTLNIED